MSDYPLMPEEAYWEQQEVDGIYQEIEVGGIFMQVRMETGNRATIIRLLRCGLNDYLNPAYAPGREIVFVPVLIR